MVVASRSLSPGLSAEEITAPEQRIKAAFLYNFAKLVDWPAPALAGTNSPIVIGILGRDTSGGAVDEIVYALDRTVRGKTINCRKVVVRRIKEVDEAAGCQVLFVSRSENSRLPTLLLFLADRPILTVGEDDFARRGGIIGLRKNGDTIQFEINTDAAARARLQLSSQLLRLAILVHTERSNAATDPDPAPGAAADPPHHP